MTREQRRLDFEGAVNFRDLGGYPACCGRRTRWRQVYRSDSLADLSHVDQGRLAALGLRTLIDFRLVNERRNKPNRLPIDIPLVTVEIGFLPKGVPEMFRDILGGAIDAEGIERHVLEHYRLFPIDHNREYRQMLDLLACRENFPLLIHCASGKDRTGYGAAVILMTAGASREVILEDYALTNLYRREIKHLLAPTTPQSMIQMLTSAQPKYLEAAFEVIDRRYGSIDGYLERGLGLDAAKRARLVELLTEPESAVVPG